MHVPFSKENKIKQNNSLVHQSTGMLKEVCVNQASINLGRLLPYLKKFNQNDYCKRTEDPREQQEFLTMILGMETRLLF